ncbi:MAG: hypothetical protein LUC50_01125 [Ruminococcus sp.]|nr:hypothetical protein [Ruminococcus sp.]
MKKILAKKHDLCYNEFYSDFASAISVQLALSVNRNGMRKKEGYVHGKPEGMRA